VTHRRAKSACDHSRTAEIGVLEQRAKAGQRRIREVLVELAAVGLGNGPSPGEGACDLSDSASTFEGPNELAVRGKVAERLEVGIANSKDIGPVQVGREPTLVDMLAKDAERDEPAPPPNRLDKPPPPLI
jgi:hypothetical protein